MRVPVWRVPAAAGWRLRAGVRRRLRAGGCGLACAGGCGLACAVVPARADVRRGLRRRVRSGKRGRLAGCGGGRRVRSGNCGHKKTCGGCAGRGGCGQTLAHAAWKVCAKICRCKKKFRALHCRRRGFCRERFLRFSAVFRLCSPQCCTTSYQKRGFLTAGQSAVSTCAPRV